MRHFRVTAGMYWCWQGSWLGKQLCSSQHDAQGLHLELLIRIHKHDHINCLPLPPPSAGTWCALSSHPKHPIPTPAATTCEQGYGWGQGRTADKCTCQPAATHGHPLQSPKLRYKSLKSSQRDPSKKPCRHGQGQAGQNTLPKEPPKGSSCRGRRGTQPPVLSLSPGLEQGQPRKLFIPHIRPVIHSVIRPEFY